MVELGGGVSSLLEQDKGTRQCLTPTEKCLTLGGRRGW